MSKLTPQVRKQNTNPTPFNDFARMQREMNQLFNDLGSFPALDLELYTPSLPVDFIPACDLNETDTHFVYSFDVPGMKKEDMKVELRGNTLTISGQRKTEYKDKNGSERYFGTFQRSFSIPSGIAAEQIETHYADGVLRIAVPKTEASKSHSIKIGETVTGLWDKLLGHKVAESKPH